MACMYISVFFVIHIFLTAKSGTLLMVHPNTYPHM